MLALGALFLAAFLAATLLPGGSEAAFYAALHLHAVALWPALAVATLGNTLGGMTSYLIGRYLPQPSRLAGYRRSIEWVRRYGALSMLGAWLPVLGDPLCLVAGWLRLPWVSSMLYMALGKFIRYWLIAQAA